MTDTSTDSTGAQTRFFPRPGAVSFKRLLGGCIPQRVSLRGRGAESQMAVEQELGSHRGLVDERRIAQNRR